MTEYKTEFLAKTRYISAKIVFIDKKDKKIPSIKIKHQIGANGICNIEKISQYWKYVTYKSDKFKPTSTRIQFAINSNDLSVRLLHPYCPVWSYSDHISFYEESEEDDVKKTAYQNNGQKIWMPHAGSTCALNQRGEVFIYPNKVKLIYKIKEKSSEAFKNSIKEVIEVEKEAEEKKEDDVISMVSLDNKTEIMEKEQQDNTDNTSFSIPSVGA